MNPAQIKARIISNKRFKDNYWHLEFESGEIAKRACPGQFVNIKVSDGLDPLLRRPISIHRARGQGAGGRGQIEILYEVIGRGTQILSQRKPGELLDIIGPLGNGFWFPSPVLRRPSSAVLVAGGMGVAPLVFLAEKLTKPRTRKLKPRPLVLIGAKTKKQILCENEFKKLGCEVKIATDDGSRGFKGKATDLLKQLLSAISYQLSAIYACGPQAMLKAVAEIARENKISSQLSLEEHMACGIGACLGCVVKVRSQKSEARKQRVNEFEYKRVCKEGPVFKADEIIWED